MLWHPTDLSHTMQHMQNSLKGFYDRFMGEVCAKQLLENKEFLTLYFQEQHGLDLEATVAQMKKAGQLNMHTVANCFLNHLTDYESTEDFCAKVSTVSKIKDIQVPTLFLNSQDDPLIEFDFDKSGFTTNPNVLLATTKHGGHLGAQESLFQFEFWHIKPAKAFL